MICKPVLGMGGADVELFRATDKGRRQLSNHFRKCMKKYPGLVVQKAVKGFGMSKDCPELRMYFLADKYKYSVSANANCVLSHPKAEGGTLSAPLGKLKIVAQNIIKKLPPIVMPNGVRMPRLITRLDMGWRVDGRYQPFLNEIEVSPSLYNYKPLKEGMIDYISGCGRQIVKIARRYTKGRRASGKASARNGCKKTPSRSQGQVLKGHVLKPNFLKHRLNSAPAQKY